PVVVAGGALEGCLDQRPALQRQVLVIALTKGDLADVLDPVAGHLRALELEHHPFIARVTGGANGGQLRRGPLRGLCSPRAGPGAFVPGASTRVVGGGPPRPPEPDPPQAASESRATTSRPRSSRVGRAAIAPPHHAWGSVGTVLSCHRSSCMPNLGNAPVVGGHPLAPRALLSQFMRDNWRAEGGWRGGGGATPRRVSRVVLA